MTSLDRGIAAVLVLTAVLNERDFVVPPHDIAPVGLEVFQELVVKLKVLTNAHDDVLGRHTRVRLVTALIPLALAEVESANAKSDINDGTLLSCLILRLNTSELSILVAGQ